jgi:hypothetical protein
MEWMQRAARDLGEEWPPDDEAASIAFVDRLLANEEALGQRAGAEPARRGVTPATTRPLCGAGTAGVLSGDVLQRHLPATGSPSAPHLFSPHRSARAEELASLAGELRALAERYAQLLDRPGLRPVLTLLGKAEATVAGAIPQTLLGKEEATARRQQADVLDVLHRLPAGD